MKFGMSGRGWGASRDVKVHESGHAVARVLLIGRVGITNENAIRWIRVDGGNPHVSVMALPYMPGLKEAGERLGVMEDTPWTLEQRLTVFKLRDIDPLEWARVRFFEIAAGAAAEAKFRQVPFDSVWRDNQCSDDRKLIAMTCVEIGLNQPEAEHHFAERSQEACAAMNKTDVWRAVIALADRLPPTGQMPGATVVSIVQDALNG